MRVKRKIVVSVSAAQPTADMLPPMASGIAHPQNYVRVRRKARGMTQMDLAVAAEVGQSMVSDFERRKLFPSLDAQQRIAAALGCEWLELFVDPESPDYNLIVADAGASERQRIADVLKAMRGQRD